MARHHGPRFGWEQQPATDDEDIARLAAQDQLEARLRDEDPMSAATGVLVSLTFVLAGLALFALGYLAAKHGL